MVRRGRWDDMDEEIRVRGGEGGKWKSLRDQCHTSIEGKFGTNGYVSPL